MIEAVVLLALADLLLALLHISMYFSHGQSEGQRYGPYRLADDAKRTTSRTHQGPRPVGSTKLQYDEDGIEEEVL